MKKDPKLVPIDGGGSPNVSKEAIEQLKKTLPDLVEYVLLMAKLSKVKYDALIKEGFSKQEAIELSKTVF